ncbi:hypothetical protein PtrSN002B_002017 [Pyrenophora tritici-repentis]|uniref:Uncharacterized protein n=1 Tax=Pyrenophora tritici-repentis TaxID=45151 RepID=A0A2W1F503_9PLEO|nr:hypothetical protein PtrV1_08475 [Pyrenophora tritici-repentis]KAF7449511.1 hypothetical protein A1F99_065600 [Pyrenophora tritici-repentis]KAF7570376.1 hypothetical protein PtrM4_103780 [Pyrenophora tritici-repentis]KAG9383548.1 hypothetical protein A1F94_005459 [Pyrenophora tritici-repentis]KAI0581731.1 hypothetical protein Alg130_06453 [Pyrenophora tritici-repentis]
MTKFFNDMKTMNLTVLFEQQGLCTIPHIYSVLYQRTRTFAATVRSLVDRAPAMWAEAACLLVDWSVHVLRRREFGLERFLPSQRESLYWTLDDALLRICVDQWDPPKPTKSGTSSPSPSKANPWDTASAPIALSLSKAQELLPLWGEQELEHWGWDGAKAEWFEAGWFRRSRDFLRDSTRIHEIWRTMSRWGEGQLPAELANVIVEDVASFEDLPMGDLRAMYFPGKK